MAGIVESMFAGTKYGKDWLRNAAGGAYAAASGLTELPVRGAMALGQMAQGRSWADVDTSNNPIARGRAAFGGMTGLPTEEAEPGQRAAFGFGRGVVGAASVPTAIAAGGINALAETVAPDSPLVQAAINLTPAAVAGTAKGVSAVRAGALRKFDDGPGNVLLSKGQEANKARILAEEDFLATHVKSADKVAKYKQIASDKAKTTLQKFLKPLADSNDASAGLKAAERWKQFETSQVAKHDALTAKEFPKAFAMGGNVKTKKVVDALEELYDKYSGKGMGSEAEALANELGHMLKGLKNQQVVGLELVQSNLDELGKAAKGGKSVFDNIAPGRAQGVSKALFKAWSEALEDTALSGAPRSSAAAKQLIKARENFAVRVNDIKALNDTGIGIFMEQGKTGERVFSAPEKVMAKLRSLTPTERDMYVAIMEQTDGTVVDNLRKNILENVIKNAEVPNASARQPSFSFSKFLNEFDKVKDDMQFLIPDAKEREAFTGVVDDLRKGITRANVTKGSNYGMMQEAGGVAQVATGSPGAGAITRGLVTMAGDLFTNKDALADLYFGAIKKPTAFANSPKLKQALDVVTSTGGPLAATSVSKAVPGQPQVPTTEPEAVPDEIMKLMEQPAEAAPAEAMQDEQVPAEVMQDEEIPEEILKLMEQSSPQSSAVTDDLLDRISKVESSHNPVAVGPATRSGQRALGQYQFMPGTANELNINPFDPDEAREGARTYLSQLLDKYNGDMKKAVAAYNWGPGNVDKYGLEKMPSETRNYLQKVLGE